MYFTVTRGIAVHGLEGKSAINKGTEITDSGIGKVREGYTGNVIEVERVTSEARAGQDARLSEVGGPVLINTDTSEPRAPERHSDAAQRAYEADIQRVYLDQDLIIPLPETLDVRPLMPPTRHSPHATRNPSPSPGPAAAAAGASASITLFRILGWKGGCVGCGIGECVGFRFGERTGGGGGLRPEGRGGAEGGGRIGRKEGDGQRRYQAAQALQQRPLSACVPHRRRRRCCSRPAASFAISMPLDHDALQWTLTVVTLPTRPPPSTHPRAPPSAAPINEAPTSSARVRIAKQAEDTSCIYPWLESYALRFLNLLCRGVLCPILTACNSGHPANTASESVSPNIPAKHCVPAPRRQSQLADNLDEGGHWDTLVYHCVYQQLPVVGRGRPRYTNIDQRTPTYTNVVTLGLRRVDISHIRIMKRCPQLIHSSGSIPPRLANHTESTSIAAFAALKWMIQEVRGGQAAQVVAEGDLTCKERSAVANTNDDWIYITARFTFAAEQPTCLNVWLGSSNAWGQSGSVPVLISRSFVGTSAPLDLTLNNMPGAGSYSFASWQDYIILPREAVMDEHVTITACSIDEGAHALIVLSLWLFAGRLVGLKMKEVLQEQFTSPPPTVDGITHKDFSLFALRVAIPGSGRSPRNEVIAEAVKIITADGHYWSERAGYQTLRLHPVGSGYIFWALDSWAASF
ncbi:hypothetical protein B0H11DRAFT_2187096 [Mycena galericulata]|nr:hypothetical protein B0H11DRAFT_2187096 [Mycena galericulata]